MVFMLAVEIPMYTQRYQADEQPGALYLWISDGLTVDAMSLEVVVLEIWAEEMPWMTAWVSSWMTRSPSLSDIIRRERDYRPQSSRSRYY